jgi:hypothetical protein
MKQLLYFLMCCAATLFSEKVFSLNFHKTQETLDKIKEIISKEEKGAYLRFGDGDIILACGGNDHTQPGNFQLQNEMREAMGLNGPTVLKALPLTCRKYDGLEPGMSPGNHEHGDGSCESFLHDAAQFWNGEIEDVYSQVALHYAATSRPELFFDFMKFLKSSGCAILIGNANIPSDIRELLFGSQCQFVPTPSLNSFEAIDRIEQESLEKLAHIEGYKIIVTCMGPSGKVLQKRLWNQLDDVFLFDFGSLIDAICGWPTRDWIVITHFNHRRFRILLQSELGRIEPQPINANGPLHTN